MGKDAVLHLAVSCTFFTCAISAPLKVFVMAGQYMVGHGYTDGSALHWNATTHSHQRRPDLPPNSMALFCHQHLISSARRVTGKRDRMYGSYITRAVMILVTASLPRTGMVLFLLAMGVFTNKLPCITT
jgi:hypothetical protein